MKRREFVSSAGVAGLTLLAGCLGGSSGPADVVERNFQAFADGDAETFREDIHSNSTIRDDWEGNWENFGPREGENFTVEETEVLDEGDEEATVRLVYRRNRTSGRLQRVTSTVELRREDGAWKIWEVNQEEEEEITDGE